MKKISKIAICLLVFLSGCANNSTIEKETYEVNPSDVLSTSENNDDYIDRDLSDYYNNIDEIAEENSVLGMQVVVFKDGKVINSYNYGYSDLSKDIEVDDNTVFRIASTSKTVSNILVMQLVEQGKINLTDSVNEVTGLAFDKDVELWNILSHTSGYGDSDLYNSNMETYVDINTLIEAGNRGSTPGTSYEYSNFVAGTMAAIVERVSGEYFSDYANEHLFDLLDMNSSYVAEDLSSGTVVAKMHYYGGSEEYDPATWQYDEDFYKGFGLGNQYRLAHGNLLTSASDLAKIGIVLAGDGTYNGVRILNESTLDLIRYKRVKTGEAYSMGLNTDLFVNNMVSGRTIYGHTGFAYGAVTALLYDPSDQSGVVILTNSSLNAKDNGVKVIIRDIATCVYNKFFD